MFSFLLFFLLARIIHTPVLAASSVSVSNPPDSQRPPIAHINSSYSFALAPTTFQPTRNTSLTYSADYLPAWLLFDPVTRTFSGTPKLDDEGTHRIKVSATDPETSDTASTSFSLYVTSFPSPVLSMPVASQFKPDNPSLASVFVLSDDDSALQMTTYTTLRIPPHWSFSIGFDGDTFTGSDIAGYDVLLEDGSPLPYWMNFNFNEITLTGVTPLPYEISAPYLTFALHALDQYGFSSGSERFAMVIAAHEVHISSKGLPTINITSSEPLDVSFDSPTYFAGVFVDNAPLDIQDLISLEIDVSPYDWLYYDEQSRRLTGQPPTGCNSWNGTDLSVVLTTMYNQSLHTQVKLACVPSCFSQDTLPAISVAPGRDVYFNLAPFCANAARDVNLTASYVPVEASSFLHFDTASAILSGSIPSSGHFDYSLITVLFTAYSPMTHSISHSSLPISLTTTGHEHSQPTTASSFRVSRRKLALGLGIALALLGGLLVLGLVLAALRCLARPPDSALTGAAATQAMTERDRQWYGIGDVDQTDDRGDSAEKGYSRANGRWGELGIGLSRVMTAASSNDERTLASPGQLSKGEFLGRLRSTVRKVSNRYRGARKSAIGRPVLVLSASDPRVLGTPAMPAIPALAGYEPMGYSGTTSTLHGSPSSSSGERSIPQRRADFAPPRVPAPVAAPVTSGTLNSDVSLASDSSTRSHAVEAVVQRATRARSIGGGRRQSRADSDGARARVVPFTASRIPAAHDGASGAGTGVPPPARASSLSASVVRVVVPSGDGGGASEADELHVGLHYVRALGEDARDGSGSFSSVESSHPARSSMGSGGAGGRREILRVLVRVGERFRFRLPVRAGAGAGGLTARRVSGELLPAFLYADLDVTRGDKHRDTVKFWGVPRADDVGDVHVGVYTANGECVAEAVIEVLIRSS
jgi:axial budding pattern protein 2